MTNKNEKVVQEIRITWAKRVFAIATFAVFIFLILGQIMFPDERDIKGENYNLFEAKWVQVKDDGTEIPVDVPGTVDAEYGEEVVLRTVLPENLTEGEYLCFRSIWQDIEIYIDGQLREQYSTEDSRPFGTNSAFRYTFVRLGEEDSGKDLRYHFSSDSKYAGVMREAYIGDKIDILYNLIADSGLRAILSIFLMLLSLLCIIICAIFRTIYKKSLPLNYLAWALFFAAFWMLSEIGFRQIIFKNVSIITSFTYWSLMLIPIPLIVYMNDIQNGRYSKVYVIQIVYSTVMLVTGTILQVFDIVQFVEQLIFIHIGVGVAIFSIIGTITVDVIKKRISDYLFVGIGIFGMLATAILEMILYYLDIGVSIGTMLGVGLLFLLIMAIVKSGTDLFDTEKKKQQAISAKEAQAKFLANMSHEIRTPINVVLGMNEMILRENDSDSVSEYAMNIKNASNMLLGLVNDILDFSKIESGQLELVSNEYSLSELIKDEMLILNSRISGKAISAKLDIDQNLPSKLLGDELRVKQIVTNIISNAAKYTQVGEITVKVIYEQLDKENIQLVISVSDTGVGIKEEDLSELFDSFKRLELDKNRNIEGSGLGLNIVKQLVDLMNGDVSVKSEYGKGSTFTVKIPQRVIDSKPIGELDAALKQQRAKNEFATTHFVAPDANIMVVDDNAMNLTVVKSLLKRTKVKVSTAKSGRECLELTKKAKYDIILMDHMMPELDGIETLKMLRAESENINRDSVVIALTANAIVGCREMYISNGFNDYMSKPIEASKLEELLVKYLPAELVHDGENLMPENNIGSNIKIESEQNLLYIDRDTGLGYCMNSEELYNEILEMFCKQSEEYLVTLEECIKNKSWKNYATIAHALKGNALNIGAGNFSKLSYEHELAGKEDNEMFIVQNYEQYVAMLKKLVEKIRAEMLS